MGEIRRGRTQEEANLDRGASFERIKYLPPEGDADSDVPVVTVVGEDDAVPARGKLR